MMNDILEKIKHVHFVGIGGSGMCPIAEILCHQGYTVSGSDNYISDTLQRIMDESHNITVYIDHAAKNIDGAELVVYSAAVKEDNIERVTATQRGIPCIERSVMMGLLCMRYKNTIAVSGTHGKTTTTAMITQILTMAGEDPSAIIGGKLPFIGGNGRVGQSGTMVCEACEYVDTFLHIIPSIAVITNVEADHLDYFGTLENVIKSFGRFAAQATSMIIANGDDQNTWLSLKNSRGGSVPIVTFGTSPDDTYCAAEISDENVMFPRFVLMKNGERLTDIKLSVPGRHNVLNAVAAAAVSHCLGIPAEQIALALHEFRGVHRRFEILGQVDEVTVVDDFAHHPTEISSTLQMATKMGFARVIAVFQPHTYSRTAAFLCEFAQSLSIADITVLSEILAVREVNEYNVTSEDLAAQIDNCICLNTFEEITDCIEKIARPGDLVLTMGGGNVYVCANMILARLKEKHLNKR